MQKLILTAAHGYGQQGRQKELDGLLRMVTSAARNCGSGHIVVFTDAPLPLPHYCEQVKMRTRINPKGREMHPVVSRFFEYVEYLQFADPLSMVAIVDARDVVFQGDIFRRTKYNAVTVHCENSEHRPDEENANRGWLTRSLGFDARMQDDHGIACAGCITGQASAMLAYLCDLCGCMHRNESADFGDDQAAHNFVARHHRNPIHWRENGDQVLHCVLTKDADVSIVNGHAVLKGSKGPAAIVHQYDRHDELMATYCALYGPRVDNQNCEKSA